MNQMQLDRNVPPAVRPGARTLIVATAALMALLWAGRTAGQSTRPAAGPASRPAAANWDRPKAVEKYVQGFDALQTGDKTAAESLFKSGVEENPDLIMARGYLGDMYRSKGDASYYEAARQYEAVTRLDPYCPKNHYLLGLTYQLLGRFQDAAASYLQALRLDPADRQSNMNLGIVYLALGKPEEAARYLAQAAGIDPAHASVARAAAPNASALASAADSVELPSPAKPTLALARTDDPRTQVTLIADRPATGAAPSINGAAGGQLTLMVNKSTVVTTRDPYKRVSIAQPEIADVTPVAPTSLLVTAKKPGATQLVIWDDQDRSQSMDVVVQSDLVALQEQLRVIFPSTKIEVSSAAGAVVLRGRVPNLQIAEQAAAVAGPYSPKVLNFLEVAGGQQVMLLVRFAEVSRTASSALGVNFGFSDGVSFAASNVGQVSPLGIRDAGAIGSDLAITGPTPAVTLFGRGAVGNSTFAYFVSALRQNNLLRVLAEPNLIATSGQEASFLAGGDFPVPVVQGGAAGSAASVTVEYKEFGIKLNFVPMVLGDGRICLKVAPEVSDIDFTNAVRSSGFLIPGRRTRKLMTTIELAEGQTFAVAGLLDNRVVANKDVTPLLGDVPVLGALFRSVRYQRSETELVVLVTPRLVEAMNPAQVPQLPGETWRHPSEPELFLNQDFGGPVTATSKTPATRPAQAGPAPRFQGQYGFTPATTGAVKK